MSLHDWAEGAPRSIRIRGVTVFENDWVNVRWADGLVGSKHINSHNEVAKVGYIVNSGIVKGISVKNLDGEEKMLPQMHITHIEVRPKVLKQPKLRNR